MREEAMQVGERFRIRACVECTEVRRERGESWVWIRLCGGTSIPSGGQRGRRRHHRTQDGKERTCAKLAGARPIAIDPLAESLEGAQHTREVESVREQHESADCEAKRRLAILVTVEWSKGCHQRRLLDTEMKSAAKSLPAYQGRCRGSDDLQSVEKKER
jgi:hypothetical protein